MASKQRGLHHGFSDKTCGWEPDGDVCLKTAGRAVFTCSAAPVCETQPDTVNTVGRRRTGAGRHPGSGYIRGEE